MSTSYRMLLSIGLVGCKKEEVVTIEDLGYDEEGWDELSDEEKEDELEDCWKQFAADNVDGWREEL